MLSANETEDAAQLVEEVLGTDTGGVAQALLDASNVLPRRRLQSWGRGLQQDLLLHGGVEADPLTAGNSVVADLTAGWASCWHAPACAPCMPSRLHSCCVAWLSSCVHILLAFGL